MRCICIPILILMGTLAAAQTQGSNQPSPSDRHSMRGMDMSRSHDGSGDMASMGEGGAAAMHSMESHHMDMAPHRKMNDLRPVRPGDKRRAEEGEQGAGGG